MMSQHVLQETLRALTKVEWIPLKKWKIYEVPWAAELVAIVGSCVWLSIVLVKSIGGKRAKLILFISGCNWFCSCGLVLVWMAGQSFDITDNENRIIYLCVLIKLWITLQLNQKYHFAFFVCMDFLNCKRKRMMTCRWIHLKFTIRNLSASDSKIYVGIDSDTVRRSSCNRILGVIQWINFKRGACSESTTGFAELTRIEKNSAKLPFAKD